MMSFAKIFEAYIFLRMRIIDGRVFVSLVGAPGVPARLATISEFSSPDSGPLLRPYPDWSWHRAKNCEGITSVYRMAVNKYSIYFIAMFAF